MLFQVTDPTGRPVFEYLLALHVNPGQLDERMQKSKNVVMTYGGFVEFHWPDELDSISADATTGAFIGPNTGLVSGSDGKGSGVLGFDTRVGASGRQHTMAWERQEDLLDLFRNNGQVFNGAGQPVLRGQVMLIYDRGIFYGHFPSFEVVETDEKAFSFELSWEFKVERSVHIFPTYSNFQPNRPAGGVRVDGRDPGVAPGAPSPSNDDPNPGVDGNVPNPPTAPANAAVTTAPDGSIIVNGVTYPPNTVVTTQPDGTISISIGGSDGDPDTPI